MNAAERETPAVEIRGLERRFGRTDAVNGLNLTVAPGRCHAIFGRNGAGKSTTMKCLLNHLRPTRGVVRVFGLDPARDEVAVKASIGYVPEVVAFHPWMTVAGVLEYAASFRPRWNKAVERGLLDRFGLDPAKRTSALSKGMRSQLALICAIAPEPDLLLLDEPTSGLDPIVRGDFVETVIGEYQEAAPERRTVLVSTHLIREFEGLVDEFTIVDGGRDVATLAADEARARFKRIRLRFEDDAPEIAGPGIDRVERDGREASVFASDWGDALAERLRALGPAETKVENLSLEEIFVAVGKARGMKR